MKSIVAAMTATVVVLFAPIALANSETWYVVPEDQGECGDECYTPPTAWIDEPEGRYALGLSCDDQLVLGGKATYVSEITIGGLEMTVDGQSLGRFSVESGLNDVYVQPQYPGSQAPTGTAGSLSAGQNLTMTFQDGQTFAFTLAGARAAIALTRRLCRE